MTTVLNIRLFRHLFLCTNKQGMDCNCLFISLTASGSAQWPLDGLFSHTYSAQHIHTLTHTDTHGHLHKHTHLTHKIKHQSIQRTQTAHLSVYILSHYVYKCITCNHSTLEGQKHHTTDSGNDRDIFHVDGSGKRMRGLGRGRDGKGRGGGGEGGGGGGKHHLAVLCSEQQ